MPAGSWSPACPFPVPPQAGHHDQIRREARASKRSLSAIRLWASDCPPVCLLSIDDPDGAFEPADRSVRRIDLLDDRSEDWSSPTDAMLNVDMSPKTRGVERRRSSTRQAATGSPLRSRRLHCRDRNRSSLPRPVARLSDRPGPNDSPRRRPSASDDRSYRDLVGAIAPKRSSTQHWPGSRTSVSTWS